MGMAAILVMWPRSAKIYMADRKLLKEHFYKNFRPNICSSLAVSAIFQFSTLSVFGNSKLP